MVSLTAKRLTVTLGGVSILKEVDFHAQAGEMLGLIGPNGAGKTTLLRLMAGLIKPDNGGIALNEIDYKSLPSDIRTKKIAYLAQAGAAHWPMTVERIIALGRLPHLSDWQQPGQHDEAIIDRLIQQTDVTHLRDRRINTLSGGERARVLLARALAGEPEIVLADEPVAALDLSHQIEVMSLLRSYCEQGGAVVVVLHDLRLAAHFCHRIQVLNAGRTAIAGSPSDVFSESTMSQVFGIKLKEGFDAIDKAISFPWETIK